MIVVDATVLAVALADDGPDGDTARTRLAGEAVAAPDLIYLEVASAFRSQLANRRLDARRAGLALLDLAALPLSVAMHALLLPRAWELRQNLSVYDGAYVALAEALDVVLVTADTRLAGAPGLRCRVELMA